MSETRSVGDILDSKSITHKFDKERLVFLNTSDVLEGKILIDNYMDVADMKGQAKKTIQNGDILFSEIRPKNKRYAFVSVPNPEDYVVSTKLMVLRNKTKDVLTKYIYYFLTYEGTLNYLQMRAENRIGSFPQITFDILKELKVYVPKPAIQQKIVDILSALDAKIELNQRINAELESMAKTLYDYWFVQFAPHKSAGGAMVWNEALKREIPLGWEVKKVRDFAETSSGGTPLSKKKEYYENGTIPWINSGELNEPFIVSGSSFITEEGLNNSSAKMFPENTVLVALYGATAGKVSLLRIEACTNQAVCALLPTSLIYTNFLKYGFGNLYDYLVALSSGSARDNLSQEIIRNIPFAMPPDALLEEFNKIVNPLLDKIVANLKESQTLTELRDWLLPMLMNGQVKV